MKETVITWTLCIISSSLFYFQWKFFFSLSHCRLPLMYYISAANYGSNGRCSNSRLIFCWWRDFPGETFFLPCVSSACSAPPSWQLCGNGRVVVKLPLFSKWNLTMLRLLALQMCVLRWDRLHWAVWSGLVTEGQMLSGGGERVHERGKSEGIFFWVGTWVKWKPLRLFFLLRRG